MNTWIIVYEHRHGVDVLLIKAEQEPTEKQVQKTFPYIDWELDREDERISVIYLDQLDIRNVEL